MCGIAGIIGRPNRELLAHMGERLRHRGPDGEGIYVSGKCGLSHRRLAIVDREGGRQPMTSRDERLSIVFNGEIYNHRQLRRELCSDGLEFASRSDTEVL